MTLQLFTIRGMHCEACTKLTTRRIKKIPDVTDARVDLNTGIASIQAERRLNAMEINDVLSDTNYQAEDTNQ